MKIIFYLLFLFFSISGGIYFFSLSFIEETLYGSAWEYRMFGAGIFSSPVAIAYLIGKRIWKGRKKECYVFHGCIATALLSSMIICELLAKKVTPSWPAVALHGVEPEKGKNAWGRIVTLNPQATGINSWGQRDKERSRKTRPGKKRIVFIGDSLLEESSITPINLLVEERIGSNYEVINLGVSGTSPEEYYWRTKNVALKIGAKHVVVFISTGNDLLLSQSMVNLQSLLQSGFHPQLMSTFLDQEKRRLFSFAPYQSVLGTLTPGINYYFSKKQYKAASLWINGNLHNREQKQLKLLQADTYEKFVTNLLSLTNGSPEEQNRLKNSLSQKDLSDLYQAVLKPDMDLFRSSLLRKSLLNLMAQKAPSYNKRIAYQTYNWLLQMKKLCISKKVKFSVVIAPQGVAVDDRLRDTYLPISNLRENGANLTRMADLLKGLLEKSDTGLVDLYGTFQGKRGTYLNFDGHWSQLGNKLAAEAVSDHLLQHYKER